MNYKGKKVIVGVLLLALTLLPFAGTAYAIPKSSIIHESTTSQIVTSGVTYENITRFTTEGWLNINALRIDLSNEHIQVDTLVNTQYLSELASTKSLAESRGAVAAVNASFFTPTGNGSGYPDGPIVESGKIISSTGEYNLYGNYMASFSLDGFGKALYNYWKSEIKLQPAECQPIIINQYNKPSKVKYTDFTILDRRWSDTSIGANETYPDIVEMVVIEGEVVEIRQSQPPIQIPQNGYVVVTRQSGGERLLDCFEIGDSIDMSVTTTPEWNSFKMSVTGSSMLVMDGEIPDKFSFDLPYISKRQPRTVVGTSQDGSQLILVTVDGRQNNSIGLTQLETARLMLDLGAYNALNLDGGGSTTMVGRSLGSHGLDVVNSPSDGITRSISTAIGIFSIAPPGPLAGLVIETEDQNVFVNTTRTFSVKGYDKYFNPISVDPSEVSWEVSGINGTFENNVLHAESVGEGKVSAKIGDITASINISSLSSPVKLELDRKQLKLPVNQSQRINVTGFNKNGFTAKINPKDIVWSVTDGIGEFSDGIFTAKKTGAGYIDAAIGNAHAYCGLIVTSEESIIADSFEKPNGSFLSYPNDVTGEYKLSSSQVHSGKYSGQLSYSFNDTEETQAAYLVFADEGISIDPQVSKIGVWVYNGNVNSNWLRAEVIDSSGKKHLVSLSKNMDWTGWKYVDASIENISPPATLTRLYIAKVHPIKDSGSIFFDDLKFTYIKSPQTDIVDIPEDTIPIDEANVSEVYQKTPDSFRLAVFNQLRQPANLLENLLLSKLYDKINNYIDYATFIGNYSEQAYASIDNPVLQINSEPGYNALDIQSTRLIRLDTSKGGIRSSNAEQWFWLFGQIDSFKGDNLLIFLESSPDNFRDNLEANLFKETLTAYRKKTSKNIWVFFKGKNNSSYMERGVRYISSAGLDIEGLAPNNTDIAQYILVTIKGNRVIFEFKPVI
jgi:exopolysaccharide biosynthesis protein